ncbi:MAG TPA: amidase [Vicinamibacterales bacterium]|nr:amidase [Vicinamibacterales bacterium]
MSDLCFMSATELVRLIQARRLSARELMQAHLDRISLVNPALNAIVAKLDDERCLALAAAADERAARREPLPPLHGLPIAFKDLQAATGFPFTRGSLIYQHEMPGEDSVLVDRLRRAGAVPIGKTNVPEFGFGSHTYNSVYGTTLNPYDRSKSAGGSSGGAGAALAAGMLPIADGSDLGGSLRNPANFNNVVGMRPSVGLVPTDPDDIPVSNLSVNGPMARTVADVAFLMSVMAGPGPSNPDGAPMDSFHFRRPLERSVNGVRVAWCPDLGGLPLDRRVRSALEAQRATLEALGCVVEDAAPDLDDADSIFLTLRAYRSAATYGSLLAQCRHLMKPEAIKEVESGQTLTSADVARAMARHGELLDRFSRFQERYEFVFCAVNQVPPFDAAWAWPRTIDGVAMTHYVEWMKSAYWISVTCCPAISVPAGFTPEGLPVGIQIVGRRSDDFGVLQMAYAFEQATGFGGRRPQ